MKSNGRIRIAANVAAVAVAGSLWGCGTVSGWMHRDATPPEPPLGQPGFAQSVSLAGANEVPPVETKASGGGSVIVNPNHGVIANITVTGMAATAAHIHMGAAGTNGPVIVPLAKVGDNAFSAPAGSKMTDEQYAAFKAGNTYVNVHSDAYKGGEIRAQLSAPGN
jgi:hypothetical protein